MMLLTVSSAVPDSFTLCRGYTNFPTRSDFVPCCQVTKNLRYVRGCKPHAHSLWCGTGRSLQGFSMASSRIGTHPPKLNLSTPCGSGNPPSPPSPNAKCVPYESLPIYSARPYPYKARGCTVNHG